MSDGKNDDRSILIRLEYSDFRYLSLCKLKGGHKNWRGMLLSLCRERYGDLEL